MVRAIALLALVLAASPVAADDQPNSSQKAALYAKSSVVRVHGYYEITFKLGPEVFKEYVGGMGSGFFASADGWPGEGSDVAVIKVDAKDAPNLQIADSERIQVQDKVLAIGYPGAADMQGLLDEKSQLEASINDGAVSAMKHSSSGEPIIQIT